MTPLNPAALDAARDVYRDLAGDGFDVLPYAIEAYVRNLPKPAERADELDALDAACKAGVSHVWGGPEADRAIDVTRTIVAAYLAALPQPAKGGIDLVIPALLALTKHGVPTDVQDLIVNGNADRGVRPGALQAALAALPQPSDSDVERVARALAREARVSEMEANGFTEAYRNDYVEMCWVDHKERARAALAAMRPAEERVRELVEATVEDRADWLLDAIAAATQDRQFLRGDPECNPVVCEAILLNGKKAIRMSLARFREEG